MTGRSFRGSENVREGGCARKIKRNVEGQGGPPRTLGDEEQSRAALSSVSQAEHGVPGRRGVGDKAGRNRP